MAEKETEERDWIPCKEKRSEIWSSLLVNRKDKNILKCKHCNTIFRTHQTTTSYRYHMQHKHNLYKVVASRSGESNKLTTSVTSFFVKKSTSSPALTLAKLIALDRIPFATLANSEEIKNGWKAQGLNIPLTEKGIKSMVMEYAGKLQEDLKNRLKLKIENWERFSLSLDEWTSKRNRRYMCLNIHTKDKDVFGLGMIRINESMPATKAVAIVEKKLKQYGIDLRKHVVVVVTDGAAVMKKMGSLMCIYHQICHSHGIHLGVTDVLYKKIPARTIEETDEEMELNNEVTVEVYDSNSDESGAEDEVQVWMEENPCIEHINCAPDFSTTIQKVRDISRMFRKSPVKNDILQKVCKDKMGKELNLIIDTSIRWNSMLAMLKRFLEMNDVIKIVLQDLSVTQTTPSIHELNVISEIVEALDLIEVSSLALGKRDCNLIKGTKIFEFMLSKLKEQSQSSVLAHKFYTSMSTRINERRNPNLEGLLLYLENPIEYLNTLSDENLIFKTPTKNEIANTAKDIANRLLLSPPENPYIADAEHKDGNDCVEIESAKKAKYSKANELQNFLSKKPEKNKNSEAICIYNLTDIKREMMVYEHSKVKTDLLQKIYNALLSVPLSSVESERSFSAAGLFVTKLRTSLNDETLDKLCFLRAQLLHGNHK